MIMPNEETPLPENAPPTQVNAEDSEAFLMASMDRLVMLDALRNELKNPETLKHFQFYMRKFGESALTMFNREGKLINPQKFMGYSLAHAEQAFKMIDAIAVAQQINAEKKIIASSTELPSPDVQQPEGEK